ncbi:MAG: hypothetical protein ACT4PJ_09085 [Gemmatimonadaceae bacterium]
MIARAAMLLGAALITQTAEAQSSNALEVRADAIVASRVTNAHVGIGGTHVMSRNLELQLVLGGGVAVREGVDENALSGRGDLLARFAPMPDDGRSWSAYVAGGVSTMLERGARGRAVLALLVGVEGGRAGARRGFFELGLGGGLRAGAGVRF